MEDIDAKFFKFWIYLAIGSFMALAVMDNVEQIRLLQEILIEVKKR